MISIIMISIISDNNTAFFYMSLSDMISINYPQVPKIFNGPAKGSSGSHT